MFYPLIYFARLPILRRSEEGRERPAKSLIGRARPNQFPSAVMARGEGEKVRGKKGIAREKKSGQFG